MDLHVFNDAAIIFLPNAVMRMVDLPAEDLHSERAGGGQRGWLPEGKEERGERGEFL